jgi:hypothetical protein
LAIGGQNLPLFFPFFGCISTILVPCAQQGTTGENPRSRGIVSPSSANDTENGTRHNVTFTRLYKDGDDWKTSSSFGRDELPLVAKVADLAHSWIFQQGQEQADPS